MICKNCGFDNPKNALHCRRCHESLVDMYLDDYNNKDEYKNDYYEDYNKNKEGRKSDKKSTNKTKTKTKTKSKTREKYIEKENKKKDRNNTKYINKEKTPFGTKVLIILMALIILGLSLVLAFIGYKYYQKNYNIEVPNLIGETYEGAKYKLAKKDLNIEKKEKKVDSEDENGIVIKQSKNEGTKVKRNTKIKVVIGVFDNTYKVPNLVGLNESEAIKKLNELGIKYQKEEEYSKESDGKVIKQSLEKYKKANKNQTIIITIGKKREIENNMSDTDEKDIIQTDE